LRNNTCSKAPASASRPPQAKPGQRSRQTQAAHHIGGNAAAVAKQRRQHLCRADRNAAHHQRQGDAQQRQPGEGSKNQQGTATGRHAASYFGA
jgi:hypothetical protein